MSESFSFFCAEMNYKFMHFRLQIGTILAKYDYKGINIYRENRGFLRFIVFDINDLNTKKEVFVKTL